MFTRLWRDPEQGKIMLPSHCLERFGFNPQAEAVRLQKLSPEERVDEFIRQRESHLNHVAADFAVSNPYNYWLSKDGNLYSSPTEKEIYNVTNQVDKRERNGIFYDGILEAAHLAQKNPQTLIILYSPTGKKLFDSTPIYDIKQEELKFLKKPYDIGQLYFLYFGGNKIRNVAVSVNSNSNPWLLELAPEFKEFEKESDEETRIVNYLKHPINLGNIDVFFNKSHSNNHLVFKNVNQREFYLDEVLQEMRFVLSGKKKIVIDPGDKTIQALQRYEINAEIITQGYLYAVHEYMRKKNQTTITFGGGCSGTSASLSEIESILGFESIPKELSNDFRLHEITSSFSTAFRNIRQKSKEKNWDYHDGTCVICKTDPTKVGPCNICIECEKKFDK